MAEFIYGTLPESSVEEALSDLLEAKRLLDLRGREKRSVYLYLAKCYSEMGNTEKANEFLTLADKLPLISVEDRIDQREVDKMLGRT